MDKKNTGKNFVNIDSSMLSFCDLVTVGNEKNFLQTDNCLEKVFDKNDKRTIDPVCRYGYFLYLCWFKSLSLSLSLSLTNYTTIPNLKR